MYIGIAAVSVISIVVADKKNEFYYSTGYGYYDSNNAGIECSLDGISVWVPKDSDKISYEYFPSTPHEKVLDVIEMRGDSLKDGFRIKEEYRDTLLLATGKTVEENPFE